MNSFTIDGGAQGATALAKGFGAALQRLALADTYRQDAYLDTLGKTKHAEEARGIKLTNDHRERADEYAANPSLSPHHKAALLAFKLLGDKADHFSRSAEIEQTLGHREAVINDQSLATPTAQAHFATSGKAPFDNVGTTGHSVNQVTGEQIVAHPGMAKLFSGRSVAGGRAPGLTLPQQRGNAEIDAARETVAGLTPEDIRYRTAKTLDYGKANSDYDPTLARSVSLAGRRKIGTDQTFDNRSKSLVTPTDAPALPGKLIGYAKDSGKAVYLSPNGKKYTVE